MQPFPYWSCLCVVCRLGVGDRSLERSLAAAGCEVHCFDPGLRQPHQQEENMWLHRLSVDWRDPNPAVVAQRQYASTKKLATILNDFGHRQVRERIYFFHYRTISIYLGTTCVQKAAPSHGSS